MLLFDDARYVTMHEEPPKSPWEEAVRWPNPWEETCYMPETKLRADGTWFDARNIGYPSAEEAQHYVEKHPECFPFGWRIIFRRVRVEVSLVSKSL